MAGIGFRLQKYFKGDTLSSTLRGALYSVIISSGPWLITVLAVAFVSVIGQRILETGELLIFRSVVCYTYAMSLILFGVFEMPITRFLADKLYNHDVTTFKGSFLIVAAVFSIILGLVGHLFYYYTFPESIALRLVCSFFLVSVSLIWLSMVFLSAAKNFHPIIWSFLFGGGVSVGLSWWLGLKFGLLGYLSGFVIGQVLIAIFLIGCLFLEYQGPEHYSFEVFGYFKKHRFLVLIGLSYYIGIWIDKALFWYTEVGQKVQGLLYTSQYYDTAMFLAYLTIVPTLAVFLVKVETDFYVKYSYYFRAIQNKNSLNLVNISKDDIYRSLKSTLVSLVRIQLLITIPIWLLTPQIISFLHLPTMMIPIFKYGILGAFLQGNFLIYNIILLYFERPKMVLKNYFLFAVTNGLFSYVSISMGDRFHGLGYVLSCFLIVIISYIDLNKALLEINFYTFMTQSLTRKNVSELKL